MMQVAVRFRQIICGEAMRGWGNLTTKEGERMRTICADCGIPQPDNGSLHLEGCPAHNPRFCVVCLRRGKGQGNKGD